MRPNILFLLYKSKENAKGQSPIKCRVTYKKRRHEFSTGFFATTESWNSKKQEVLVSGENFDFINIQLHIIKQQLQDAYLYLKVNVKDFTSQDIVNQYKGKTNSKDIRVVQNYILFCNSLSKLVGKELNQRTYDKYLLYGKHLKSFIRLKYKSNDIQLKGLKSNFLTHFDYYLKTEKGFAQSTINKIIQRFRRSIRYAISEEYLQSDPFLLYRAKVVKKEVIFLSKEQLDVLEEQTFTIKRLAQIKDMFVFCCYTGLAFKEMAQLKKHHIVREFDDEKWIHVHRNKTKRTYKVPLLPKALEIIKAYSDFESEYVFPRVANSNFNAYLKEIAAVCGIDVHLTHHIARKTFASTVLLYNDVPMEIVSELLGHSKIQTTQEYYGKIVQKKVSQEIMKLNDKL